MISFKWRWASCLLLSLAVAGLLHSNALIKHFYVNPEKVGVLISGPRTDVGDNYYYFTMLRHAPERFLGADLIRGDSDGSDMRYVNPVTNSYAAALFAGHLVFRIADSLTTDSRTAVLLTSIFLTAVLALSLTAFATVLYRALRPDHAPPQLPVLSVLIGMVFVDAFGNGFYFGKLYWDPSLLTHYSNTTRLVNPNLFWASGLLAVACTMRWIQNRGPYFYAGALASCALTGLFSISTGATLALALCLTAGYEMLSSRVMRWDLFAIALASVGGVAWSYLQIRHYSLTPLGKDLQHGQFLGFQLKWHFLMLLALIPLAWRLFVKGRSLIIALILSASLIGLLCESFNLGSRLWLRGAVIYAWVIVIVIVGHLLPAFCSRFLRTPNLEWALAKSVIVIFIALIALLTPKLGLDSWKGFIEKDKWSLFDWIDKNLPRRSVISSPDIEDSYLLPIYTSSKPLFTMYGITSRTRDQELRRYFYNMRLYGQDQRMLEEALGIRQENVLQYLKYVLGEAPKPLRAPSVDAIIFLELVLYYSYIRDLRDVMSNSSQHAKLEKLLVDRAKESELERYAVDYAIIVSDQMSPTLKSWHLVYKNSRYAILKNPGLKNPGALK